MRKQFKFYKSYYDVFLELPEKNKLEYLSAIFEKQFFGKEPNLKGIVKLAYVSQKHSIDLQVKGYEDKTGETLDTVATQGGIEGAMQGGIEPPTIEEEVKIINKKLKEEEEEEEEEKKIYRKFAHLTLFENDFNELNKFYEKEIIDSVLDSIENYKKNTNYKSLFLTAKKWLKSDSEKRKKEVPGGGGFVRKVGAVENAFINQKYMEAKYGTGNS